VLVVRGPPNREDLLRWRHVVARRDGRRWAKPQPIEELTLVRVLGEVVFGSGEAAAHADTLPGGERPCHDLLIAGRGGSLMRNFN
jgi:hypothetical protein